MPINLSDLEIHAGEIIQRYEYPKAAMLPLLWLVQQKQGYVSAEAEAWVGRLIGVSIAHVREVVSFYNMFHTKPLGRRELRVCTSLPRSEEHTSELQSLRHLVCRLLLEKKKSLINIDDYNYEYE